MDANDDARRLCAAPWIHMFEHAPPALRRELGIEVIEEASGVALVCPGLDHAFFNRAYGARWTELYAERGVRRFFVEVERGVDGPSGLERYHRDWDRFCRPLSPDERWTSRGALRLAAPADRDTVGALFESCFDMPKGAGRLLTSVIGDEAWCTLVAERDGEVVAAGFAFAQAEGVYLAIGAVAPHARGRGIQRDLIAARLSWAIARGSTFATTETGIAIAGEANPSSDNLRRAGFEVVGGTSHFTLPGTRWAV